MIRRQLQLPVGPARLWDALTDPYEVSKWFGGRLEWDLLEGGALSFTDDGGRDRVGQIDVVRPGRYLRFRWWPAGASAAPGGEAGEAGSGGSEVSYLLEAQGDDGDSTRLTIQERQVGPPVPVALASFRALDAGVWTVSDGFAFRAWASRSCASVLA